MTNSVFVDKRLRAQPERTVTIENITPDLALKYLDTMPHNRRVRHNQVTELVVAMESDKFFSSIEPIHFDIHGKLRNGQHRMTAVIQSGKTVEMMVVRGASEDEIDAIDTGNRRNPGDLLALRHGVPDGDTAATALKHMWNMERGVRPQGGGIGRAGRGLNNHEMGQYFLQHPNMVNSVAYINETPSLKRMASKGTMAFCHYAITNRCPDWAIELAETFWHNLARDIYHGNTDPIYRLRERLQKAKVAGIQNKKDRLNTTETCALIFKAWNFWIAGKDTTRLAWRIGGDIPEDFPKPNAPKSANIIQRKGKGVMVPN